MKITVKTVCHFHKIVQKVAKTITRTLDQRAKKMEFENYMECVQEAAKLLKTKVGRVQKGMP